VEFALCHGCDLCLLTCPVWRQTRDVRLTPHGRAKALQHGATAADLHASIASCTLCGSCEPACPEEIPLVDMILELRRAQPLPGEFSKVTTVAAVAAANVLLPGEALRKDPERLKRIAALLDIAVAADDGSDISRAIECGAALAPDRLSGFLSSLKGAVRLVVADGLLLRKLREWLPEARVVSLGEALSTLEAVRSRLRATDLYVIEPRAFHADHARLVRHYDTLIKARNLKSNLDLQRLAVPTCASSAAKRVDPLDQARWILDGRAFERVVVEDAADCAVFARVTDRQVLHIGDL
jgi:heterodisulfide reductase subunit C